MGIALGILAACSSGDGGDGGDDAASTEDAGATAPGRDPQAPDGAAKTDAGSAEAGDGAAPPKGPPASSLPITFTRSDVGTPLTPAEVSLATDELIALLAGTHFYEFVNDRIHGWPESDPAKGYWYGHFWTGVSIQKTNGVVTFKHSIDGSDNVGIATAPYLEGACYGYLMWGDPKLANLTRRMIRGYTAWIKAMVRTAGDPNPTLLARSFYRPNVTDNTPGRPMVIDYSASYPGVDNRSAEYVHVPTNPTFGDIWIKNKRSKDDIGQILRSMSQIMTCGPRFDAATQTELAEMKTLYESWAKRVDSQGFSIETLDKSQMLWAPSDQLAHYSLIGNLECLGALNMRLKGSGAAGDVSCGTGLSGTESLAWNFLKNDARQIVRTNHASALLLAYEKSQNALALELVKGLSQRVEMDMNVAESPSPPSGFQVIDVAAELVFANNVGVPLTSREVRYLHARLHEGYSNLLNPVLTSTFRVFDPATPDGPYSYDPPTFGLPFRDLGMLIGACASTSRNPAGRAVLDCPKLLAAF